jgi:uncharacterized membrane protein YuzA (DUF378 family)
MKIKIELIYFMKLNIVDTVALVLVVVGGINWGLIGLLNFDLVATLFGPMSTLSKIVYSLVGLSAVYLAIIALKLEKKQ